MKAFVILLFFSVQAYGFSGFEIESKFAAEVESLASTFGTETPVTDEDRNLNISSLRDGEYGTRGRFCGMDLTVDRTGNKLYAEGIRNYYYPHIKCSDYGTIVEYDCAYDQCITKGCMIEVLSETRFIQRCIGDFGTSKSIYNLRGE